MYDNKIQYVVFLFKMFKQFETDEYEGHVLQFMKVNLMIEI